MNFNIEKYIKKYYILNESSADKKVLKFLKTHGLSDYNKRMRYITTVRASVPNLELDHDKFMYAIIRMGTNGDFDGDKSRKLIEINNILKVLHDKGLSKNYNEDLNGATLSELLSTYDYEKIYNETLNKDQERSKNKIIKGDSKYIIEPFEFYDNIWNKIYNRIQQAVYLFYYDKHKHDDGMFDENNMPDHKYFEKTEPLLYKLYSSQWCVTYNLQYLHGYTSNGQRFYMCYNKDFLMGYKDLNELYDAIKHLKDKEVVNKILPLIDINAAPLDLYGLSAIAINVDKNGALERVTTRWNHEFNGENPEGLETAELIEDLMNIKFYDTFKPYSIKDPKNLEYNIKYQMSLPILGKTYPELVFENGNTKIGYIFAILEKDSKKYSLSDDINERFYTKWNRHGDKQINGLQLVNDNDVKTFVSNLSNIPKDFVKEFVNLAKADDYYEGNTDDILIYPALDNHTINKSIELLSGIVKTFDKSYRIYEIRQRLGVVVYIIMYKYDYNNINNNVIKNPSGTIYRFLNYVYDNNVEFKKLNCTYSLKENIKGHPILYKCDKNDNGNIIGMLYDKTNKRNASCVYIDFLNANDDFNKKSIYSSMVELHISYDNGHYNTNNKFIKPFLNDIIDHIKYLINNVFTNIDLNITYINGNDGCVIGPLGSDKIQLSKTNFNFDKEKQYIINIYYTIEFVVKN